MRPPGGTARRAGLAGHHVLLVEDNGLNREIAVELLNMADITVECAVNGREAVERFLYHGDSFDLILMDVQMPVKQPRPSAARTMKWPAAFPS